jgi:hypothetical protein
MEYATALFFIGLIAVVLLIIEVNFTYATQGFFIWLFKQPQPVSRVFTFGAAHQERLQ